jgi:serine/threonine protein kinase
MASASAAGAGDSARDQSNIELRPYGFDLVLDTALTQEQFLQGVREYNERLLYTVDEREDSCVFKSKDNTVSYRKIEDKNAGNFGSVSVYTDPDGNRVAIKKITFKGRIPFQTINFIRECIIQIILAETSRRHNRLTLGVPALYKLGVSESGKEGFIVSEFMENTLYNLVLTKDNDEKDSIIPDALLQIADILDFFEQTLRFNHRDMKTDNVMYTMVDGRPIYRLIDFGMSCLTWNQLSIDTTIVPYFYCFKEGRDLGRLMYEFIIHKRPISERLKEWIIGLHLAPDETIWLNSSRYFNTHNTPQASPQRLTESIKAFVAKPAAQGGYTRKRKHKARSKLRKHKRTQKAQ